MTLWILSPFSASYTTYSIFTNCFLQRYYINTLYRQFKQMRYSSVVKVNIICFCRIGHTTAQFFAFLLQGRRKWWEWSVPGREFARKTGHPQRFNAIFLVKHLYSLSILYQY